MQILRLAYHLPGRRCHYPIKFYHPSPAVQLLSLTLGKVRAITSAAWTTELSESCNLFKMLPCMRSIRAGLYFESSRNANSARRLTYELRRQKVVSNAVRQEYDWLLLVMRE